MTTAAPAILRGWVDLEGEMVVSADARARAGTAPPSWPEAIDQLWRELGNARRAADAGDRTIDERIDRLERRRGLRLRA